MSAEYKAHALIGVKVNPAKLYTERKVKAFEHGHPESINFDPITGKALWRTEKTEITRWIANRDMLGPYRVVHGTDNNVAFIGLFACDTEESALQKIPIDFSKHIEGMRDYLSPLGLWNESQFGLWAVLYCSY